MSRSWMEKQGQVGDLRLRSKEELQELLLRQEGILSNRRLLQTLPDKGKKIEEFAEKIRFAIEQLNEEDRRRSTVCDGRAKLQSMYKQAFTAQQCVVSPESAAVRQNHHNDAYTRDSVRFVVENPLMDEQQNSSVSSAASADTIVMVAEPSMNSSGITEGDLVEAFESVALDESFSGSSFENKVPLRTRAEENYLSKDKRPHYVTVLERKDTSATSRRQKFKPNQPLHGGDTTAAGSLSPSHSSEGSSPLSVQERREQDRKHLDDITAAKLPPLHHSPAQLVSLEESAILLKEQTKKQQELQAKMAAQKLSEELKLSMGSFTPDATSTAAYREVHDEGAELSSDDD